MLELDKRIRKMASKGDKRAIGIVIDTYDDILKEKATKEGKIDQDLYEQLLLNLIVHLPSVDL